MQPGTRSLGGHSQRPVMRRVRPPNITCQKLLTALVVRAAFRESVWLFTVKSVPAFWALQADDFSLAVIAFAPRAFTRATFWTYERHKLLFDGFEISLGHTARFIHEFLNWASHKKNSRSGSERSGNRRTELINKSTLARSLLRVEQKQRSTFAVRGAIKICGKWNFILCAGIS